MAQAVSVKMLMFDIGGTVFDWSSAVADRIAPILMARGASAAAGPEFALAVRKGFLDLAGAVCRRERAFLPAGQIYAMVMDELLERLRVVGITSGEHESLHKAWHAMPAWPGAREAIAVLREAYTVVPLTILSFPMTVGSSKSSGIAWDGILPCDLIGIYKPDPRCYSRALEIVGCRAEDAMMVASHPSDLRASKAVGLRTAYVQPRLADPGEDYTDTGFAGEFDIVAEDFQALVSRLMAART